MSRHRFLDLVSAKRLPETAGIAVPSLSGFMACPMALRAPGGVVAAWQTQLYQWAFEQARPVTRPSLLETRFAPSLN